MDISSSVKIKNKVLSVYQIEEAFMLRSDIRDKTANFIMDFFIKTPGMPFSDDTLLLENGILDSTGVIELVTFIEATFGVIVEDEEIIPENLNSCNRITEFIQTKILQKTSV